MNLNEAYNEMMDLTGSLVTSHETIAEKALAAMGISPEADFYSGAKRDCINALKNRETMDRSFWESYLLSLCRGSQQPIQDKRTVQAMKQSIITVRCILIALTEQDSYKS